MKFIGTILCIIGVSVVTSNAASVEPIWLSPTNVDLTINENDVSNIAESFIAEKGVWANLTVGAGSRAGAPAIVMDSKGTLWIFGGERYGHTPISSIPLYAVWNYDPKTDLYRYVWGGADKVDTDQRNTGELRVPAETNHPGYIAAIGISIDKNDNIWMTSIAGGELWMFNTTSMYFTRLQGEAGVTDEPTMNNTVPGQPSENVWPGYVSFPCLVTDSQNNIWMLAGQNYLGSVNTVWHFNTTSLLWSYITGSFQVLSSNETFFGGTSNAGCFMDNNDKVWMYGGYATFMDLGNDLPVMWSFDTRGKAEWEVEYSPTPLTADSSTPVKVSVDYDPDNSPGGCEGCTLVDRMDGTLMLFVSSGYTTAGDLGGISVAWQYSKSLKQWRLVYGDIGSKDLNGVYTNYRQPGSSIPGITFHASSNGQNMNGDIYVVGGSSGVSATILPGFKDIWLIPNDQCSSPTANKCSVNADCIEEMIGYSCECKQGYTGDGFTCVGPPVAPVAAPVSSNAPSSAPVSTNTPSKKTSSASVIVSTSIIALTLAVIAL